MHVDGVKFEQKSNPINPIKCAKCLKKKERRPIWEGIHFCCTARQSKENKNYIKLFVSDIQQESCDAYSYSIEDEWQLLCANVGE